MADLFIEERTAFGLASVHALRGVTAAQIGERLNVTAPSTPRAEVLGAMTVIGAGPGAWLVLDQGAEIDWAERLEARLAELASVSDQSAAYCILRFGGAQARQLLQKGVHLDLHPDVFGPGSAASTLIGYVGVVIWQVDAAPTYELAFYRSYQASFRAWLEAASASL